jgi:hypothetical protein
MSPTPNKLVPPSAENQRGADPRSCHLLRKSEKEGTQKFNVLYFKAFNAAESMFNLMGRRRNISFRTAGTLTIDVILISGARLSVLREVRPIRQPIAFLRMILFHPIHTLAQKRLMSLSSSACNVCTDSSTF